MSRFKKRGKRDFNHNNYFISTSLRKKKTLAIQMTKYE